LSRPFRCSIVTPSASVFDEDVQYVSMPAWDGQMGVMCDESPVLTRLGAGVLRINPAAGNSRHFMIDGGFAQVRNNTLTLLTEAAIPAEELSMSEADAELAEANARVTKPGEDQDDVRSAQDRALAKKAAITAAR